MVLACSAVWCGEVGAEEKWLSFLGKEGAGKGKRIVLVSGDEVYRSEESLPMLAKILSKHHGFDTTVLFSWSEDGTYIDPSHAEGVVGWESLASADLLIIGTRFRVFTPETLQHLGAFLNAGKPVVGIRTATHAFRGEQKMGTVSASQWGLRIFGETWVGHHGRHKVEGTRAVVEKGREKHPVLNSVRKIFTPSDVYGVKHLTRKDTVLLRAAVTESLVPSSKEIGGIRNDPMMPLAWLHSYEVPEGGRTGRSLCMTMGASVDFLSEDLRRLLVNGVYHLLDLEVPKRAEVSFVDPFYPSFYGPWKGEAAKVWRERALVAEDFGLGRSPIFGDPSGSPKWKFESEE